MEKLLKEYKDKPNKEILTEMTKLKEEFDKTKSLVINLTNHLDSVESRYNLLNNEMKKRNGDG
jgi:predicted nuclease with TOPRIM domain